jgi:hypothetical protein
MKRPDPQSAMLLFIVEFVLVGSGAFVLSTLQMSGSQSGPAHGAKAMHRVGGTRDDFSIFAITDHPQLKPLQPGVIDFKHYQPDSISPGEWKTATWQVMGTGTATGTISSTRGGVDKRQVAVQ